MYLCILILFVDINRHEVQLIQIHLHWCVNNHTFCDHVKYFWYELSNCLKTHCTHLREISLSVTDILFGKYWKIDDIDTLNFIILIAKYYINKCRYNNERSQINNFRKYLLFWYKVEKQVEFTNCNWEHFDKRWNLYYFFINNL